MAKRGLAAALAWAALAVIVVLFPGCGGSRPPVVLVTVAGLRADAVGKATRLAGLPGRISPDPVTPVPDTAVALEALFTGHGLDRLGNRYGDLYRVPPDAPTLAERLAERGYRTAAFVGDGRLSAATGLARGFAEYHVPSGFGDTPILTDETSRLKPRGGGAWPADRLRDAVGAWLSGHAREGRFFLWVHLGDPSAATGEEDPAAAYREAVRRVDAAVGDIVGALRTYGVGDDAVVAVVSLHGEGLGERGETGHGIFLSPPVVRVPAWVGRLGGGAGVPGGGAPPADLGAVGRTIARLAGCGAAEEPSPARSATWWPSRLYGWPDDGPPAEAARVLAAMAEAHRFAVAGEAGKVEARLREAARLAPRGLAPRAILARRLGDDLRAHKGTPAARAAARELDRVLAECRDLAGEDLPRRFDLARLLVALGKKDEALALAGRMEKQVATAGERLALARVYAEADASERAAEIVGDLARQEGSAAPELWAWQGDLLRRAGNTYRARQAYERALESPRGKTPETLAKLGDCLASLGEQEAALRKYAEAVRLDPTYRYPHARAAEILLEQGKRGEAATALAMSVAESGDPVRDAVERARRMIDHGLLGPAAEELERALAQEPGNPKLVSWLARVLAEAGERDRAAKLLDGILADHPDNPLAWEGKARLAAMAGDEAAALAALRRAERYAPPPLVQRVRRDPLYRKGGEGTALARFAARFGEGRRPRRRPRAAGETAP